MIDLAAAGQLLKEIEDLRKKAMREVRLGVIESKKAGVSVAEIARRAGVTRQTVYTILEEEKS